MARRRGRAARPLGPLLLVVAAMVAAASSVGAQVDPVFFVPRSVWSASCVALGATELVAYGKGWGAEAVALEVVDEAGSVVGSTSATTVSRAGGAVFQRRVQLTLPATALPLRLVATQGANRAEHGLVVSTSCTPTISAAVSTPCALAGRPVAVTVTVAGAPPSAYDLVLHHADLHGPAEAVDRTQPGRPDGGYTSVLTVANVPDRLIPIGLEARRPNGRFAFATTNVGLPPACPATDSTTTAPPGTPAPATTQPSGATTAPPPTAGTTLPVRPSPFIPRPGGGPISLAVSPAVGRAGETTTVAGRGFPPSSAVTLRWRPGIGQWTVTAGGDGSFRTQVLVLPNDIEGPRVLEVLGGGAAPAPFLVVPGSDQPAFGGVFVRG